MQSKILHIISVALFTSAVLTFVGCEPCNQQCFATADAYALCLGEWDMTWSDVGYAGIEDYEELCKEEAKLARGRLTDAEKLAADGDCTDMAQLLRSTEDCDELYDALEEIGPE